MQEKQVRHPHGEAVYDAEHTEQPDRDSGQAEGGAGESLRQGLGEQLHTAHDLESLERGCTEDLQPDPDPANGLFLFFFIFVMLRMDSNIKTSCLLSVLPLSCIPSPGLSSSQ